MMLFTDDSGTPPELEPAYGAIDRYRKRLEPLKQEGSPDCGFYTQCDIQARSCRLALEELEWSVAASERFRSGVTEKVAERMPPDEWHQYRLHVYFYKNAFIRVFSILDKLGSLLNRLFELRTERVKHRYSYYTVLRQMQHIHAVPELTRKLAAIKEAYGPPMSRLRKKRNVEVHLINSELEDDMYAADHCSGGRTYIEDLEEASVDLLAGQRMVAETIAAVFGDLEARLMRSAHPAAPGNRKRATNPGDRYRIRHDDPHGWERAHTYARRRQS